MFCMFYNFLSMYCQFNYLRSTFATWYFAFDILSFDFMPLLYVVFRHFVLSIFCSFDNLRSVFCPFEILRPIFYGKVFCICYFVGRYFAWSIFCHFDIMRCDILLLRYFAHSISYYSIFCDFGLLRFRHFLTSIFCFRYFAIGILRFDILLFDILSITPAWHLNVPSQAVKLCNATKCREMHFSAIQM